MHCVASFSFIYILCDFITSVRILKDFIALFLIFMQINPIADYSQLAYNHLAHCIQYTNIVLDFVQFHK